MTRSDTPKRPKKASGEKGWGTRGCRRTGIAVPVMAAMELRLPTDDDAPVASAYVTAPSSTVISDIAVTSPGLAMLQQSGSLNAATRARRTAHGSDGTTTCLLV